MLVVGLLASLLAVGGGVTAFVMLRKKTPPTPTTPSKKRVHWRIRSRPEGAKVVLDRFRSEVRLSRRITHKNVARMYDIGASGT